jgi:hypothetical protein
MAGWASSLYDDGRFLYEPSRRARQRAANRVIYVKDPENMSESTVRGVVHLIEETKAIGQKGFRKRLVVLEQDKGRFTNYIPLEFMHEGCDRVDELKLGDEVEVAYRLSGRKWQRDEHSEVKFFLSAEATDFKILKKDSRDNAMPPDPDYVESQAAGDDGEVPF